MHNSSPPKWADRFLKWYCRPDLLEEIQGDAYELFYRKSAHSKFLAKVQFSWNVIRFFRLKNIRKTTSQYNNTIITIGMIKNIIKVAFRNFIQQPGHSFLSVLGLTVSFLAAFLIMLWVGHEFSYDKFHNNSQQIFKVLTNVEANGTTNTSPVAAVGIDISIPEITQHAVVITDSRWPNELCFRPESGTGECIYLNGIYSQKSFFSIFDFKILQGEKDPLPNDLSMVVSEKMATLLFGHIDVVGKTLKIDNLYEVTITAVLQNLPSNSSLQFDFILPLYVFQKLRGMTNEYFASRFYPVFIKTGADVDADILTKKLNGPLVLTEELKADHLSYQAFPFTDWRLRNKFENGKSTGGRIEYVTLFIIIAILVVGMAVINFINLSTARAINRSKEIGVRKVTGALRSSIVFQFISESFLVVLFAFLLAIVLTHVSLPAFSNLVDETISLKLLDGWIPLYLLVFLLIIAIAAGLYPAVVMSSFQPSQVLKGQLTTRNSGAKHLRRVLLVIQLSISIGIIIFSGVLFNQLNFIVNKNLGYDRENMVRIEPTYKLLQQYDAFKNELLNNAVIKGVTVADSNPLVGKGSNSDISWSGKPDNVRIPFQSIGCNYDFPETFGLQILEGRSFLPKPVDTVNYEILVTESAVKTMGLKQPIGEKISFSGSPCIIIGVVNDFHTESLRHEQLPVILYIHPVLQSSALYVKYQPGSTQQAMALIQDTYKKMEPSQTMRYWFQDETFNNTYKTEITASRMAIIFTVIALVIAVIGVVGLATYNVLKKKKEISIKRVLGATVPNILIMLIREFVVIILIASLVAIPFVWYSADQWLSGFAYRIDMPWLIYIATFLGTLILIASIVVLQGFKAANSNPTQTLRSE